MMCPFIYTEYKALTCVILEVYALQSCLNQAVASTANAKATPFIFLREFGRFRDWVGGYFLLLKGTYGVFFLKANYILLFSIPVDQQNEVTTLKALSATAATAVNLQSLAAAI